MIRRLFLPLALALVVLAACSDDDGDTGTRVSTTAPSTTVTTSPTVTTGPDSSTVTTGQLRPTPTPDHAVQRLLDAWAVGDQDLALQYADQPAIDELFDPSRDGYETAVYTPVLPCRESETVADALECDYTYASNQYNGTLTFLVEGNGEDGYHVAQAGWLDTTD